MAVRLVERGVRMVQVYYTKGIPETRTPTFSSTAATRRIRISHLPRSSKS